MPDTLLMAELMPNLIWLTGSGQARVRETRELLETFRQAGCRFAGAALNREPCLRVPFAPRAAWLLVALCLSSSLWAAETPVALSAAHVSRKAAWQQRFTLGPGDALNFSLYGRPELARSEIYVDPSGCVTYLQATGVKAAGLTIDELRAKMDAELSKYYQNARVIIMPFAFHSKKFYVLGKVNIKGAFEMDRPVTLVEAVAMAGGLETGLFELNTVELADLPRSFLVRQNKRMPVDFEKLFFQGDLSQNVLIEPDDYLYFPSSNVNEIYLLGEVLRPGAQGLTANASVVSVVSLGGGFSKKAYRQKVLVVRGSLNKPESFVVNVAAVLEGKMPDFKLQPRDIVFVSSRPWSRAEELLDMAATAFVQAAVTTWTGAYIGPFITKPVLPVP